MRTRIRGAAILAGIAIAAVVLGYRLYRRPGVPQTASAPVTLPATRPAPATGPSTRPGKTELRPPASYLDVVRADYPQLPTTQPLAFPLELSQSARLRLKDPVYLSKPPRSDLWITRADAAPIHQVFKDLVDAKTPDPQSHVVNERVAFVHWMPADKGPWQPYLVCRAGDGYEVVWPDGRQPLPSRRQYLWDRAFSWNEKVVVPTRTGISIFQFQPKITESYHALPGTGPDTQGAGFSEPQALLDWQGLLAWAPWEAGKAGSRGAARYRDGVWTDLGPQNEWPEKIVHLVPLLDGSVMQFVLREDGNTGVQMGSLDRAPVDEKTIGELVAQLSDVDQEARQKAYQQLAQYGPGAWPILEKVLGEQPPQAQLLLRQLLRDKQRPTLSGMTLLGDKSLRLISRLMDGGTVFYADQGVMMPGPDGEPTSTAPAWISIRPGDYIRLLPAMMVTDLKPATARFEAIEDHWVVSSDVRGPRLFFGNGFATLLRKDERTFERVVGIDGRGRWLFRKGDAGRSPATAPAGTETLVIDPHLPDLEPRLPVWQLAIADTVGWDKDNWPVVKRGGAFALDESDWRPLPPDETIFTKPQEVPAPGRSEDRVGGAPATRAASRPATGPAEEPPPILVTPDGTRYEGGQTELTVVFPDGRRVVWPLPTDCVGSATPTLIRTRDGKLFLFNQPGRVLRLAPTPGGAQPFKREATFTHNIPNAARPTRIWLDPAGRIDIAYGDRLAICFPQGFIPHEIAQKMVTDIGLDADEP